MKLYQSVILLLAVAACVLAAPQKKEQQPQQQKEQQEKQQPEPVQEEEKVVKTPVVFKPVVLSATDPCDGSPQILTDRSGVIKSKNYPRNYENSLRCKWSIVAPADWTVTLTVEDFQVESCSSCCYDYLSIYDSLTNIGKFCGSNRPPRTIGSHTNQMDLTFRTDSSVTKKGFLINYRMNYPCVSDCSGKDDGDYQSCNGCNVYASCSNGRLIDDRPCPADLVWNDATKRCDYTSDTCF